MPAGLHSHLYGQHTFFQIPVELLRFLAMSQPLLTQLACLRVHISNLLKARMIITPYNDHVRLLSSEPLVGLRHQSLLGAWEPTLLWNHFTHNRSLWRFINPKPPLAPRFRSRASVQPHARPPFSLRPASLLLKTA